MNNKLELAFIPPTDVTDILSLPGVTSLERSILIALFEEEKAGAEFDVGGAALTSGAIAEIVRSTRASVRNRLCALRKKGLIVEVDNACNVRVRRVLLPGDHVVKQDERRARQSELRFVVSFHQGNFDDYGNGPGVAVECAGQSAT